MSFIIERKGLSYTNFALHANVTEWDKVEEWILNSSEAKLKCIQYSEKEKGTYRVIDNWDRKILFEITNT